MLETLPKDKRPRSTLDVLVKDLDDAIIHRELDNIDLLIELKSLNLIVVIENKVGAKAGKGQLDRYANLVARKYPAQARLLVFLTPDEADPEDDRYTAFSYFKLANILDGLVEKGSDEIALVLRHYLQLLRRHVVEDEKLKELALQIYERHKEAFEFVFECRPEPGSFLGIVDGLIAQANNLETDRRVNSISRFIPKEWSGIPALNACPKDQWTKTGRNVLFEVKSFKTEAYDYSDRILLSLILGPASPQLREHIFSQARARPKIFTGAGTVVGKSWATLFSRELLSKAAAKSMDEDKKIDSIKTAWREFVERDLSTVTNTMIEIAGNAPNL